MKILLSPSKEVNIENMEKKANDVNTIFFLQKLQFLNESNLLFENLDILSKQAIKLYNGLAFRQLNNLNDEFYQNVIILSSLYGYSFGTDYISNHRLDYTTIVGRKYRKEFYEEINDVLRNEDVVYNLASKEYSKGIIHHNLIEFEFLVNNKNISATSKKMRGAMVEFIRCNGDCNLTEFNIDEFIFSKKLSTSKKYVYIK